MTTNAFESHQGTPIWVQPSLPVAADSRTAVLHVVSAPDHNSAGAVLTDLSPAIRAGMTIPPIGGLLKRIMDLAIAGTALIMAAPVMIVVALLIRMTAGGPAVFSHSRIGFGGKPFDCYKFRSMVANSEEVLKAYLDANPHVCKEWEETHKIRNDPRVTLLGGMLRKSSLDELPQLFNIIRGDMSCVGPRPIVKDELKRYGDHLGEYLRTRPGLTGLWQVSGRSSMDYANRVALDSQYVRNWSVWLDIVILFRTVFAVMRFDRAS
ncbi:sugar transferase [Mesorhizobium sp. XAP10]|uniref:sugar transferase n=1 Tax=unclassified Mesorhizobium TaxID=325217 RepID=UPI0023DEF585|nr:MULTISPECIES: sugar transferase [unclassified Mesorhizobium]MDF3156496.1 sugar transferase [Mesorhizobium sp. XAP10]MDF3249416.1 sugar transferase [Mesorhizobium sp. XAP4]